MQTPSGHPFAAAALVADPADALEASAPRFVRRFTVPGVARRAELWVSALGVHETRVNGIRAGRQVLTPEWTEYGHRVLFDRIDVTDALVVGGNEIDITVGNGWYRGRLGRPARRDLYGSTLAAIARLEIETQDGQRITLVTDDSWRVGDSDVTANDLYDGTRRDLRSAGAAGLRPVVVMPTDPERFIPRDRPAVESIDALPARVIRSDGRGILLDLEQNIVGWLALEVRGARDGQKVVVRHAEVLEDGELATRPLRDARATDEYILAAAEHVRLEPSFTFHGFRYALVEGLDSGQLSSASGIVVSSARRRTAWLRTSDERVNRLFDNVVWSMRGNFVGLPTDCPQRDERLGWTADIQVFSPTALTLFDSAELLRSWMRDLALAQTPDGSVPVVVPDIYRRTSVATAGWSDAVTVVPWRMYEHTGDRAVLAEFLDPMLRWIERVQRLVGTDGIWRGGHQYADWLDPTAPPDDPAEAQTDRDYVSTAYFLRSTQLAARAARLVGRDEDADRLDAAACATRESLRAAFVTPSGRLVADTQTGYALAICFGLLDESQRVVAGNRLADLVRVADFTVATGFLGTPLLLDALVDTGHSDVAQRLFRQTKSPSWLYAVEMGATTVWERWDSLLPDGTVNPGEMTSFNHYAFGSIADWMMRHIGGITRTAPGWRRIRVRVPIDSGIDHASLRLVTPAGEIRCAWRRTGGAAVLELDVPGGTVADVELGDIRRVVGVGEHVMSTELAPAVPSDAPTVRDALDDERLWRQVIRAVRRHRPAWTSARVARVSEPYLDHPLPDLSRVVGLSIPTTAETDLRAALTRLADAPETTDTHRGVPHAR
jgi:alpha-L-rhamnosidase